MVLSYEHYLKFEKKGKGNCSHFSTLGNCVSSFEVRLSFLVIFESADWYSGDPELISNLSQVTGTLMDYGPPWKQQSAGQMFKSL